MQATSQALLVMTPTGSGPLAGRGLCLGIKETDLQVPLGDVSYWSQFRFSARYSCALDAPEPQLSRAAAMVSSSALPVHRAVENTGADDEAGVPAKPKALA